MSSLRMFDMGKGRTYINDKCRVIDSFSGIGGSKYIGRGKLFKATFEIWEDINGEALIIRVM